MGILQAALLRQRVLIPGPPLHSRPLSNPINPLQQMRERLHLLLGKARETPTLHPRPSADISNAVLTLATTCEVLSRLADILAR